MTETITTNAKMTKKDISNQKKNQINKLIADGDKRSYNEAMADLELQLWADKFSSNIGKQK